MQQTEDFLKSRIRQDRKDAKANLPTWGNMTEEEKMGWQDLTYNEVRTTTGRLSSQGCCHCWIYYGRLG